jgi:hypothetical protein
MLEPGSCALEHRAWLANNTPRLWPRIASRSAPATGGGGWLKLCLDAMRAATKGRDSSSVRRRLADHTEHTGLSPQAATNGSALPPSNGIIAPVLLCSSHIVAAGERGDDRSLVWCVGEGAVRADDGESSDADVGDGARKEDAAPVLLYRGLCHRGRRTEDDDGTSGGASVRATHLDLHDT